MSDKKIKLDAIDRKILQILQENAKITNSQLSKEIGLSPAPTLERVKKLETSGLIKSYHAVLDIEQAGLGVITFVKVSLISHKKAIIDAFIRKIEVIENIIECHHMTGESDFLLKIASEDISSYHKLMMETVSDIEEINQMQSMIVLTTFKNTPVLPLP
jgi:Lrp/AsnC family transcriptional regulator, leucine-responsive regulatory protein